jgi:hypothetical protein
MGRPAVAAKKKKGKMSTNDVNKKKLIVGKHKEPMKTILSIRQQRLHLQEICKFDI